MLGAIYSLFEPDEFLRNMQQGQAGGSLFDAGANGSAGANPANGSSPANQTSAPDNPPQEPPPAEVPKIEPEEPNKFKEAGVSNTKAASVVGGIAGGLIAGPAGAAIGSALAKAVTEYNEQGGMADISKIGTEFAKDAVVGLALGEAAQVATPALSETVAANANQTIAQGGNSLLANNAATLGDAYKVSIANGAKFSTDPALYRASSLSSGVAPSMTTGTTTTFADSAGKAALGLARKTTSGLIGGDYSARPTSGSFGYDFFDGLQKGGGIDRAVGNIKGGNYGGAIGQGVKYTLDNYRPPRPAPAFTADEYRKKNRYA